MTLPERLDAASTGAEWGAVLNAFIGSLVKEDQDEGDEP